MMRRFVAFGGRNADMPRRVGRPHWAALCGALVIVVAFTVSVSAESPGAHAEAARLTNAADQQIALAVDTYARAMQSGDRDERQALFGEAERLFAAAIEAGPHNADIETNRGNAALQAERLGPAILAYRRALLVDAGHPRARQNLAHARSLLPDWVPVPAEAGIADTFFFWREQLSSEQVLLLAAACFALACGLLALSILRGRSGARLVGGVLITVWAALIVSAVLDPRRAEERAAVVIAPEATARAADSLNAPRRFAEPLPGGTELRIIEDRGGWLHIELHNGRQAWLLSSAVDRVHDNIERPNEEPRGEAS